MAMDFFLEMELPDAERVAVGSRETTRTFRA